MKKEVGKVEKEGRRWSRVAEGSRITEWSRGKGVEGLGVEDRGVEGSRGKAVEARRRVEGSRICHPDPDTPTP